MTIFDYVVTFIIGLSVLISLMRGGVRELLSIAGWMAAFYVARTYSGQLSPILPEDVPTDALRMMAAFLILFFATLLVSSLLSIAVSGLFKKIGLGWFNRLLGCLFGLERGLLIVGVLVMLGGMTDLPKDERWANAMFSAPLEAMVKTSMQWMPESIAQYVQFDEKI
jgi:membrane protein required for colicin V production